VGIPPMVRIYRQELVKYICGYKIKHPELELENLTEFRKKFASLGLLWTGVKATEELQQKS
jgi:hypothetical protein